ncbi:ATP-grasp domain-containing protein [Gordonia sp. HY442]|uniref:ATP-grasp domain-containing protein n=1 Tax=Gordonia zhenghanii TaxID=2911516 RepID=UPI001F333A6C|nr:ATP-grasp domain-containing protein [Gordonia zhenghanii]MCF8604257.1 ATP-grasp domain-containing protein [Gordonia zhenghanii]
MSSVDPRVLATTSRMPFAVDEIRKFGEAGRHVVATDTFRASPGSHSRGAHGHAITPAPTQEPAAFIDAVIELIGKYDVNWVVPMFEEVFYLAAAREKILAAHPGVELFFPDLETLHRVHDKVSFTQMCKDFGLPVAEPITARTHDEFVAATQQWEHWFARAAYGRGGMDIITNTGPLAGESSVDAIVPTADNPWLVQQYLTGVDRCSWSVAHHGEIVLHSTYEHALTIDDRGGIVFESVDAPETLAAAQKFAKELDWHGQISFDYMKTDDGTHYMVECNPRPTAGCTIATTEEFDTAMFAPGDLVVVPAGRKKAIESAVLRDVLMHPSRLKSDLHAAKGSSDVYAGKHDVKPLLYSALSLQHVYAYRKSLGMDRDKGETLVATQFFDVLYDGSPIEV